MNINGIPERLPQEYRVSVFEASGFARMSEIRHQGPYMLNALVMTTAAVLSGVYFQYTWDTEEGHGVFRLAAVIIFSVATAFTVVGFIVNKLAVIMGEKYGMPSLVVTPLFSDAVFGIFSAPDSVSPPELLTNTFATTLPLVPLVQYLFQYKDSSKQARRAHTFDKTNLALAFVGMKVQTSEENSVMGESRAWSPAVIQQAIFNIGALVLWVVLWYTDEAGPDSDYQRVTRNHERVRNFTIWYIVVAPTVAGGMLDYVLLSRGATGVQIGGSSRLIYTAWSLLKRAVTALNLTMILEPAADLIFEHPGGNSVTEKVVVYGVSGFLAVWSIAFWGRYSAHHGKHYDKVFAYLDFPSDMALMAFTGWCVMERMRSDAHVSVATQAVSGDFLLQSSYAILGTIGAFDIPRFFDHTSMSKGSVPRSEDNAGAHTLENESTAAFAVSSGFSEPTSTRVLASNGACSLMSAGLRPAGLRLAC
jgi:hypothetical protein